MTVTDPDHTVISVRLPRPVHEQLHRVARARSHAEDRRVTLNSIVNELITDGLSADGSAAGPRPPASRR